MRRQLLVGLCLLAAITLIVSCAPGAPPATLEGTHWLLESYGEPGALKTPLKDGPVTLVLNLETKVLNGSTGCNSYFGGYQAENGKLTITGNIGSTKKACVPAVMTQETKYLLLLKTAQSFRIEGERLTVSGSTSQLVYKRVA